MFNLILFSLFDISFSHFPSVFPISISFRSIQNIYEKSRCQIQCIHGNQFTLYKIRNDQQRKHSEHRKMKRKVDCSITFSYFAFFIVCNILLYAKRISYFIQSNGIFLIISARFVANFILFHFYVFNTSFLVFLFFVRTLLRAFTSKMFSLYYSKVRYRSCNNNK